MGLKTTITVHFKSGKVKTYDATRSNIQYIKKNILPDPDYQGSTLTTSDGNVSWYDKLEKGWYDLSN
jgi:hypothetical protein